MFSQNEPITINKFPSKESLKLFDKNIFLRHDRHEHEYADVKKEQKKLILQIISMSHIPEGHQGTSIHHLSVIKGSVQGAYRLEILGREFMFSDQLETVISGLYGHDIAEHTHYYVDHKRVNRHSLLDEHQGKDVHVYYADHIHDPNRIGSFSIPVLEHHQTLRHHETGVIK